MSNAVGPVDSDLVEGPSESRVKPPKSVVAGGELLRDLLLILSWVVATDIFVYRIGTFVAWGAVFSLSVPFFLIVRRASVHGLASVAVAALLLVLSLKLLWCGASLQIVCGIFLLFCYSMALTGVPPFLPELLAFTLFVMAGAAKRIWRVRLGTWNEATGKVRPFVGSNIVVPACVASAFAALFVLANPHVADFVRNQIEALSDRFFQLLVEINVGEAVFWFFSAWLIVGLLYPAGRWLINEMHPTAAEPKTESSLYSAYRNTLLAVIALFTVYLGFEFSTLWFREFPDNFYYAGYAHEGAFWLTVALALSTLILSTIFSGSTLRDPRLKRLKQLAIVWSVLNLVLSAAVVNRLYIYIDFNGMTRMRVVGLLGICCVVAGFALVVAKILRSRSFVWLVHRQLWVPMGEVLVYAVLPVDFLVNSYNTWSTVNDRPNAVVQIISHRTSAAGVLPVLDLVDHETPEVREGVRALLALWAEELELPNSRSGSRLGINEFWRSELGHSTPWTDLPVGFSRQRRRTSDESPAAGGNWWKFQIAESVLRRKLTLLEPAWLEYSDSDRRHEAINRFFQYAYQWY